MAVELVIENVRAISSVRWTPGGVCALVGANGSGKSTLLLALRYLRVLYDRGPSEALNQLGGGKNFFHQSKWIQAERALIALSVDQTQWRIELTPENLTQPREIVTTGTEPLISAPVRQGLGLYREREFLLSSRSALRAAQDVVSDDDALVAAASVISGISVFHDPDLYSLRIHGSDPSMDVYLHTRGLNVFAILRRWHEERPNRERHEFVLRWMRAAFPEVCTDFDFDTGGNQVSLRFYPPGGEPAAVPTRHIANGLLTMLIHLTAIAAAEPGGLVAVDEPENTLHPFAIRQLVAAARQRAAQKNLTIILTTHSPVIANEFNSCPEQLFVLGSEPIDGLNPSPATSLQSREWLSRFMLGDLLANGEFGSNDRAAE